MHLGQADEGLLGHVAAAWGIGDGRKERLRLVEAPLAQGDETAVVTDMRAQGAGVERRGGQERARWSDVAAAVDDRDGPGEVAQTRGEGRGRCGRDVVGGGLRRDGIVARGPQLAVTGKRPLLPGDARGIVEQEGHASHERDQRSAPLLPSRASVPIGHADELTRIDEARV